MGIEIRFIDDNKGTWENFMQSQKPHTFLHSYAWGEFHQKLHSKVFRVGGFLNEKLVFCALILKIEAKRGSFLFCPHGPIFDENCDKTVALKTLLDELKKLAQKEHCSFIRVSPLLQDNSENNRLYFDLKFRESPIHMHSELGWILNLSPGEEELLKNMRKTTRYCIKKAEKDGVTVEISKNPEDVEKFWQVYKETVDRQNFTPFSKDYLRKEFESFQENDGAAYFFAKYNNEIVAAAMIIFYADSAFYHHGASIHKYSKIPAPYLLQWRIIQESKKRGLKWYDFWGVSPENKPKHPWAGLSLFKRGFGGEHHPYVHAKDFPLSLNYWFSWIIETVRRMKRGL